MSCCPLASRAFFHTSNILKWNNIKLLTNPLDELALVIRALLACWFNRIKMEDIAEASELFVTCEKHRDKIPESERSGIRVTAKLMLYKIDPEAVIEAINRTLDRLGISDIETLVVSLSPELTNKTLIENPPCMGFPSVKTPQATAHSLLQLWPTLEKLVHSNRVFRLGVSDMQAEELKVLCDSVEIPPKVNQVFLGSSCCLSDDLESFAKAHDIQLVTHQDPADGLTKETLQAIIGETISPEAARGWEPTWWVRYNEVYQKRGVVRSNGYTMMAERSP